jgi:hypothetical protein
MIAAAAMAALSRAGWKRDRHTSARLPGDRPGERVFGRLAAAVQTCIDAGAARPGDASLIAVNIWVALHGIVSLRTSRPHHPWPPVDVLVNATLAGQTGLDRATY